MTDLAEHIDQYGHKARLCPALLVTTPGGCGGVLIWPRLVLKPVAVTLLFLLLGPDVAAVALRRDPQLVGAAITVHVVF